MFDPILQSVALNRELVKYAPEFYKFNIDAFAAALFKEKTQNLKLILAYYDSQIRLIKQQRILFTRLSSTKSALLVKSRIRPMQITLSHNLMLKYFTECKKAIMLEIKRRSRKQVVNRSKTRR
jgi:hypothetical protein